MAHSCLISQPQWLIDMRKCPTISPEAISIRSRYLGSLSQSLRNRSVYRLASLLVANSNFAQQPPTTRNNMQQRLQTEADASNNVASFWPTKLRP